MYACCWLQGAARLTARAASAAARPRPLESGSLQTARTLAHGRPFTSPPGTWAPCAAPPPASTAATRQVDGSFSELACRVVWEGGLRQDRAQTRRARVRPLPTGCLLHGQARMPGGHTLSGSCSGVQHVAARLRAIDLQRSRGAHPPQPGSPRAAARSPGTDPAGTRHEGGEVGRRVAATALRGGHPGPASRTAMCMLGGGRCPRHSRSGSWPTWCRRRR